MWSIETTDTFDIWFDTLDDIDRTNVLASMIVLQEKGPMLSRPYADTVKGSCHSNMKELRVQSKGDPIRAFFAFDPKRRGILLCAGNKTGNDKRFYDEMIPIADREFTAHLKKLNKE
ncbi:type II toxin-antitoxin system RelE/ParE family toxin [Legionella septentrionalis]|uniref:type II toxin-antitoxin system RelE/ParE family toxin n=1 Tax=Legionella septentrionalis TaxID=2498109 RepID=UPI000F8F5042|nr:type II toxin-antitoxin system RelE/ParE family toxin [Legionella septentrionalis]RUR08877.1 diaminopimelate decarboxylase [Legionella septentrionalis]